MKIVVVYESLYGNTKVIGEAIADGLRDAGEVTTGTVDEIRPTEAAGADLIVAGGPTHIHGMVTATSRDAARNDEKHGPVLPSADLLRDWLDRLPADHSPAAAFDTRIDKPAWLTGSAAKKIARRLRGRGHAVVAKESFLVQGTDGPLVPARRSAPPTGDARSRRGWCGGRPSSARSLARAGGCDRSKAPPAPSR